ncbi:pentapeptide repeat-containing protein [Streptomyces sp. NPDC002054]|uniref:pentapeptide repeat-containing protein n=1 Tax=Streptomyces sp. NPDC002054 TaxID=3154663 RepID=UPI003330F201
MRRGSRQPLRQESGSRHRRWGLVASMLPGAAALAAVLFSWIQVGQASRELRISDEGQITNRFNTAISHLGASSVHVRIGGIYALDRIVQDSPRDNPAVTSVLSAYVRDRAPLPTQTPAQPEKKTALPADVSAALIVLANRPKSTWPLIANLQNISLRGLQGKSVPLLGESTVRNFRWADLAGSDLHGSELDKFDFREADFQNVDVSSARLTRSDLRKAWAESANFSKAILIGSDLSDAQMYEANLTGSFLSEEADLMNEETDSGWRPVPSANLTGAHLLGANLSNADLRGVNLTQAWLSGTNLTGADLSRANLQAADLTNDRAYGYGNTRLTRTSLNAADLRDADLHGVDLRGVNLGRALLNGTDLTDANLTSANLAGADLTYEPDYEMAKLTRTSLKSANLRNADLRNVDLRSVDLRGADLRGAKLTGARIKGAKMDEHTRGVPASAR